MGKIKRAFKSKWGLWTAIILTVLNFVIISGFLTSIQVFSDSVIVGALTLGFVVNPVSLIVRFSVYFIFGLGLEKLFRG